MGGIGDFFSADSTTNAEDSRIAVTDQGSAIRGSGRILHSGAVDLTNARLQTAPNFSGIKADKGSSITINEGGGGGSSDQVIGLLASLLSSQALASTPPATSASGGVGGLGLPTDTSTPSTDATGLPPPARNPLFTTGASVWLILAAIVGVIFFLVKK